MDSTIVIFLFVNTLFVLAAIMQKLSINTACPRSMRPIMRCSPCISHQSLQRAAARMAPSSALPTYAFFLDMAISLSKESQETAGFYSNVSTLVSLGASASVAAFSFVLKTSISKEVAAEVKKTEEKLSKEIKDQSTILLTLASPTVFIALLVVVFTFVTSIAR